MTLTSTAPAPTATRPLLRRASLYVWAALVGATLLSFWLGTDPDLPVSELRAVAIMAVAVVKLRLVGLHFMELKGATRTLRGLLEAYCVLVFATLVGLYLFA